MFGKAVELLLRIVVDECRSSSTKGTSGDVDVSVCTTLSRVLGINW